MGCKILFINIIKLTRGGRDSNWRALEIRPSVPGNICLCVNVYIDKQCFTGCCFALKKYFYFYCGAQSIAERSIRV